MSEKVFLAAFVFLRGTNGFHCKLGCIAFPDLISFRRIPQKLFTSKKDDLLSGQIGDFSCPQTNSKTKCDIYLPNF